MNHFYKIISEIWKKTSHLSKLKFILPLILTLTLSSCNKEKDPNYPETITIEASDATPELKETSTQLKDFEKTYENFYSEATTEEQKITIQKIQELITKVEYEIRTMTGTMFIDEYNKKNRRDQHKPPRNRKATQSLHSKIRTSIL